MENHRPGGLPLPRDIKYQYRLNKGPDFRKGTFAGTLKEIIHKVDPSTNKRILYGFSDTRRPTKGKNGHMRKTMGVKICGYNPNAAMVTKIKRELRKKGYVCHKVNWNDMRGFGHWQGTRFIFSKG